MNLKDFNINWNEVEESSFAPVPPGIYAAKITDTSIVENKAKTGKHLKITYTLLGKKGVKNRKLYDYFTLSNVEPDKVKKGLGKLKRMLKTMETEYEDLADTSELHGKLIGVSLKVETSDDFGDQNKIHKYEAFDDDLLEGGYEDVA
jgi:hypothetical protein